MLRTCDGNDPNLVDRDGNPCDCGLIFDDVECMVVYPHAAILDRAAKDELWDKVHSSAGVPYVWGCGCPTERAEIEP